MAYSHGKYQVRMTATAIDSSSSGVVGMKWTPGYTPHVVRAFSMTNTSTLSNVSSLVAVLNNRDLTATTATAVATLNGTATGGAGVVFYKDGLDKTISPGEELSVHITTGASVAALMHFNVWVEPRWEIPGNNSDMKATT